MFPRFKKGVSEMIAYVLLIVLGVALSLIVYSFLVSIIPNDELVCPQGISLVASSVTCENKHLNLTLLNNGLFRVNGAFIRFGNESQEIKKELQGSGGVDFWLLTGESGQNNYLLPGNSTKREYLLEPTYFELGSITNGKYLLEIEPAIINKKGTTVACNEVISVQTVICTTP